jgi:tryptophanyl-tRNA synthetase
MAADILAVDANVVPVGRDQKQHVEVTRDLAIKFNLQYGEVFTLPKEAIRESVAVVPGLDGQKMSKSYNNTIEIFGEAKETRARIMRIVTDSKNVADVKDPETCNVFALYRLFATESEREEMAARYRAGGLGYGDVKKALHEKFEAHFAPLRLKRAELAAQPDYVEDILRRGAEKARGLAAATLKRARRAMGLE